MDYIHETSYVVYVRLDKRHTAPPGALEQPVRTCSSYAEAREVQRLYRRASRECVIRFEGITGGGD